MPSLSIKRQERELLYLFHNSIFFTSKMINFQGVPEGKRNFDEICLDVQFYSEE